MSLITIFPVFGMVVPLPKTLNVILFNRSCCFGILILFSCCLLYIIKLKRKINSKGRFSISLFEKIKAPTLGLCLVHFHSQFLFLGSLFIYFNRDRLLEYVCLA